MTCATMTSVASGLCTSAVIVGRSLPQPRITPCATFGRRLTVVTRARGPTQETEKDETAGSRKEVLRGFPNAPIDPNAPSQAGIFSKFSNQRELWTGRAASFGMFAAAFGEVIYAKGPIGQLSAETGLSSDLLGRAFIALIAFNALSALLPGSPTWSRENQEAVNERGAQAAREFKEKQAWPISLRNAGLNNTNEVLIGRIAMMAFLGAVIYDISTGGGAPLRALLPYGWAPGPAPITAAPIWLPLLAGGTLLLSWGGAFEQSRK